MLYRHRNANTRNEMQTNTTVKDSEAYNKNWLDHLKRMNKNLLPRMDLCNGVLGSSYPDTITL
jgi:hypothetical protein